MMVPALAEQHAAHKARRARMAGIITATATPLPYAPPVRPVTVPAPVLNVGSTRKHQIAVLQAAGYSQGRIAARLGLTVGQVAGVLHRNRAEQHKLLLCDCCLILFDLGFDTYDIGILVGEPERAVYALLSWARERKRVGGVE